MTFYTVLADLVVIAHAAYVLFVVIGQIAIVAGYLCRATWIRHFWIRVIHLAFIAFVVAESWLNIVCPLTTLEKHLRRKGGGEGYEGDFIGRWVHELLFVNWSPLTFTIIYTAFGLSVLLMFIVAPPRWKSPQPKSPRQTS